VSPAERFLAALVRQGRAMTLKRRVGTTTAFTSLTVHGRSRTYRPEELTGGVAQGDRRIRISALELATWDGAPQKNDLLDGAAVQGADALYDGETLVGYVVWVRG
jgi:hypothetical protein